MRCALEWVFWLSVGMTAYTYVVYPAFLFLLHVAAAAIDNARFLILRRGRRMSDKVVFAGEKWPTVSFLLAARNEEAVLRQKIENFLAVDYPPAAKELLVGSDASEDGTVAICQGFPSVRVFDFRERSGKIGVLKKLLAAAEGEILVFSDANTFFEPGALKNLIRHFADASVGAVCGELRLTAPDGTLATEGAYWRFETILKTMESRFGAVLGANGGIYAVRKELFPDIPSDTIIEDFVIPLLIRKKGYRTPFDPEAVALERNPVDSRGEFRRRARIGAGCLQAVRLIRPLLSPRFGMVSFALWSHKILRWAVPPAMVLAGLSNAGLVADFRGGPRSALYSGLFAGQLALYALAAVGGYRHRRGIREGIPVIPFMFVSLNAALLTGYFRYLAGRHRVAWERTARVDAS